LRYWWVNQNQTYRLEVGGGYLWSPKRKSNDIANPFYDFMREVSPGDAVFSFSDTLIRAIGMRQQLRQVVEEPSRRFGEPTLVTPRLGQGAFRVLVTDAYERRCAITGERTLPVLEAAHILPFAENGPHDISNGLLMRSDFHKLFDAGLVTITDDLRVEISNRIRDEWSNGKAYYRLHGQKLASLPKVQANYPKSSFLQWHNENRFRA
jgi:putative restriction endonuclease